jgi:hypothetical protein
MDYEKQHCLITSVWAEFLARASSKEVHQALIHSNWDDNQYLLDWLLTSQKVDKATALIAYWMCGPRNYVSAKYTHESWPEDEGTPNHWCVELSKKYCVGFYSVSAIAMNPKSDQDGSDWTTEYANPDCDYDIPPEMFQVLLGEIIPRPEDFDEGLPFAYAETLYDLLEENE